MRARAVHAYGALVTMLRIRTNISGFSLPFLLFSSFIVFFTGLGHLKGDQTVLKKEQVNLENKIVDLVHNHS
jgi:hypothetical protein